MKTFLLYLATALVRRVRVRPVRGPATRWEPLAPEESSG